jgi:uncharacterized protein
MATFTDITDIPVIDAHTHVFPNRLLKAVQAWLSKNAWPMHQSPAAHEVVPELLARGAAGVVLLTYAHVPGMAAELNRFLAEMVGQYDNVRGLGALHPDDDDLAGIVCRAMEEQGLSGIKLHVHVLARPMDDPKLLPAYEACLKTGAWLNVHAGNEPASPAYQHDVRAISGPGPVRRVLQRYPELKLIVPHLGIGDTAEFFDMLDEYPNLRLDTTMVLSGYFYIEGLGPKADAGSAGGLAAEKRFLVDRERLIANSAKIMYGSDFPNIPYPVEREVKHILQLELGRRATENILYRTASDVFGFGI